MKKKSILISVLLTSFLLTGCSLLSKNGGGKNVSTHLHNFEEKWSYNEDYHYHKCSVAGCSGVNDKEEHMFLQNESTYKCGVCGYIKAMSYEEDDEGYIATSEGHYKIKNGKKDAFEPHEYIPYEGDDKHIPIEATCEKAGKSFNICTVCKKIQSVEIAPIGHHMVKIASTEVNATCIQEGYFECKCANCGLIDYRVLPALGHNLTEISTGIDGVNKYRCSRSTCGATVLWLDITKASGWNKADTKMSEKTEPNNKSTWNVQGTIEDGNYDIYVEGLMNYASHGNRKWYNMSKSDLCVDGDQDANGAQGTADKTSEDDYRYFFKINHSKIINPNVTDNWVTLGFGSADNGDEPTFGAICRNVNISGATSFSLIHGNIGYSLIISGIYLVKD